MKKKEAFTLAETLMVIVILSILALFFIATENSNNIKEKAIAILYQKSYTDMQLIAQSVASNNPDRSTMSFTTTGGFDYIECDGTTDSTECLKQIMLKKSTSVDCKDNNCITGFEDKVIPKIKTLVSPVFSSYMEDFKMVKLPSGAVIAMKYLDRSCGLNLPIYKKGDDTQVVTNACGLLVVDVNGSDKPNNYSLDGVDSDIFLFALKKNDVVGSDEAIRTSLGCKGGEIPDFENGGCTTSVSCPSGTKRVSAGTAGAFKYRDLTGTYGWCKNDIVCPEGYEVIDNKCVLNCAAGQVDINGTCAPEVCQNENTHITTQADLAALSSKTGTYCLLNDITFDVNGAGSDPSAGWSPITNFSGTFYGNRHKITNLFINRPSQDNVGLFGTVGATTINGLGLAYNGSAITTTIDDKQYNIVGKSNVGGLVGNATRSLAITNSHNTGSVKGSSYTGGLVGFSSIGGSITNSFNTGSVTGASSTGGLVGFHNNKITVTNSYNTGSVTSSISSYYTGGLVGYAKTGGTTITNSYNTGSVTGGPNTGGLVGFAYTGGSITNSFNTGSVTGASSTGGLVGYTSDYGTFTVTNSYNTGSVTGQYQIGGLVGLAYSGISLNVTNSYNSGSLAGSSSTIGGLVGLAYNGAPITNSYNTGSVTSSSYYVGGLVGNISTGTTTITTSYNTGSVKGSSYIGGVIGYASNVTGNASYILFGSAAKCISLGTHTWCSIKTDADMKTPSTFSGWDTNIWNIVDGAFPDLKDRIMPPRNGQLGFWDSSIWEWKDGATRPTLINNPEP